MEPANTKFATAVEVIRERIHQVRDRNELIEEHNTMPLVDPLLGALVLLACDLSALISM